MQARKRDNSGAGGRPLGRDIEQPKAVVRAEFDFVQGAREDLLAMCFTLCPWDTQHPVLLPSSLRGKEGLQVPCVERARSPGDVTEEELVSSAWTACPGHQGEEAQPSPQQ